MEFSLVRRLVVLVLTDRLFLACLQVYQNYIGWRLLSFHLATIILLDLI